jgi:hypothetical protein
MRKSHLETGRAFGSSLILAFAITLPWAQGAPGSAAGALAHEEISTEARPYAFEYSTPEVTRVDPPSAAPKSELSLKIEGKNFAQGAKVSFSNPGIRVLETTVSTDTELTVRIQIAPDAPTGKTSLFVVNPDDSEAEASFEVTGETSKTATGAEPAGATGERFEVYNLGDVASILQTHDKTKGTLIVAGHKLIYEEAGKRVFSTSLSEITEVGANIIFGLKTGTFHIELTSGKKYNFVAASLRSADSQSIIDSLRKAIHEQRSSGGS